MPSGTVLGSIGGLLLLERPAERPDRSFGGVGLSVRMHIVINIRIVSAMERKIPGLGGGADTGPVGGGGGGGGAGRLLDGASPRSWTAPSPGA